MLTQKSPTAVSSPSAYKKTCPTCKRTLHVRFFCRPKLQIQATCRACYYDTLARDTTGRKINNAVNAGLLPAPIAAYMLLKQAKRKQAQDKKESKRKSAQMKAYWSRRRAAP